MVSNTAKSLHGCAIVLGNTGLVVLGPSGSGKSRLSHRLIQSWSDRCNYARWVADDRLAIEHIGDSYLVQAPPSLKGLAERRFGGIETVEWQTKAIVDLVVQLQPIQELERLPQPSTVQLLSDGPDLPAISAPGDQLTQAIELIEARLALKSPNPSP